MRSALRQRTRTLVDAAAIRSGRVARAVVRAKVARAAHDLWEVPFLRSIPRGRTAIDVGAHIGAVSVLLGERYDLVVALEPNPDAVQRLMWLDVPGLIVLAAAAGDNAGVMDLYMPSQHGRRIAALGTLVQSALPEGASSVRPLAVPVLTVDQLGLHDVDFLKVDVEGFECEVLQGSAEVLARDHPVVLVEAEERHRPGAPAAVRSYLESLHYTGFFVFNHAVLPVEQFDPEIHQAVAPEIDGENGEAYANNFVYVQESDAAVWRGRLETACRTIPSR